MGTYCLPCGDAGTKVGQRGATQTARANLVLWIIFIKWSTCFYTLCGLYNRVLTIMLSLKLRTNNSHLNFTAKCKQNSGISLFNSIEIVFTIFLMFCWKKTKESWEPTVQHLLWSGSPLKQIKYLNWQNKRAIMLEISITVGFRYVQ